MRNGSTSVAIHSGSSSRIQPPGRRLARQDAKTAPRWARWVSRKREYMRCAGGVGNATSVTSWSWKLTREGPQAPRLVEERVGGVETDDVAIERGGEQARGVARAAAEVDHRGRRDLWVEPAASRGPGAEEVERRRLEDAGEDAQAAGGELGVAEQVGHAGRSLPASRARAQGDGLLYPLATMALGALFLVVLSAFLHAAWNAAAKGSGAPAPFIFLADLAGARDPAAGVLLLPARRPHAGGLADGAR